MYLGKQLKTGLGLLPPIWETWKEFLASSFSQTWPTSGHWGHLGCKPADGSFSPSLVFPLCVTSKYIKWSRSFFNISGQRCFPIKVFLDFSPTAGSFIINSQIHFQPFLFPPLPLLASLPPFQRNVSICNPTFSSIPLWLPYPQETPDFSKAHSCFLGPVTVPGKWARRLLKLSALRKTQHFAICFTRLANGHQLFF